METKPECAEPPPLVAMLRAARATYGKTIRRALLESGYDDIPGNGIFVIASIARKGVQLGDIIKELGVSKQAAGQLIDTLVLRGYLDRVTDEQDRRRLTIKLTDRGRAAAIISRTAVEKIDAGLQKKVSAEAVAHTRATLRALIEMDPLSEAPPKGEKGSTGRMAAEA